MKICGNHAQGLRTIHRLTLLSGVTSWAHGRSRDSFDLQETALRQDWRRPFPSVPHRAPPALIKHTERAQWTMNNGKSSAATRRMDSTKRRKDMPSGDVIWRCGGQVADETLLKWLAKSFIWRVLAFDLLNLSGPVSSATSQSMAGMVPHGAKILHTAINGGSGHGRVHGLCP